MVAFILALLFGIGQVFLTEQLIYAFNKRESKKILLFFGAKFLAYAIGIGLVVLEFVWHIGLAFCGFAVGVPITAIALFVYKTIYKN